MDKIPRDYVLMYDPYYVEHHEDSSDFEEACVPTVASMKGNHNLVKQKRHRIKRTGLNSHRHNNTADMYIDCDEYPVKLKNDNKTCSQDEKATQSKNEKQLQRKAKMKNRMELNSGDQIETTKSKISIFKHKVIPCISSIFKRSNNSIKPMKVIEENRVENTRTDNSCQHCSKCERRRIKNLHKNQLYSVQPVYAIEGNAHKTTGPFGSSKITDKQLQKHNHKKIVNPFSSCSASSSSESEIQSAQQRQHKVNKFRKILKNEILNEHSKYQQTHQKSQLLQYPSKDHKTPYHVFTTPFQSSLNVSPDSDVQYPTEIPASSSSFWDFLLDKMCRKYHTQRLEMPKPCQYSSSQQSCTLSNCRHKMMEKKQQESSSDSKGRHHNLPENSCSCKKQYTQQASQSTPSEQKMTGCCKDNSPKQQKSFECYNDKSFENMPLSPKLSPMSTKKKGRKDKSKVDCKCYDKDKKQLKDNLNINEKNQKMPSGAGGMGFRGGIGKSGTEEGPDSMPCQEGHDEITASLAQKYNGEILCIHNPPCILINGCLNLPPQQQEPQMSFWPVTASKKYSLLEKKQKPYREQSCQYHVPYIEVCQNQESTADKKIQSICDHDPPCEVVRGCHKPKHNPYLENSCVHVPMCEKMPECAIGKRNGKTCEHRPRCRDIPMCSRNYVVLTATDNIGTQIKPALKESFICRHSPPCIMIPKCLGRAMLGTLVSIDAIPDCVHQPPCELIPACCRKCFKEMVSVSSQYPNSCRIV